MQLISHQMVRRAFAVCIGLPDPHRYDLDDVPGTPEKTYRSSMSDKNPSLELKIAFSGLPSSPTVPPQASPSQQTNIPADRIESAVDQAAGKADDLHNPAGFETGIAVIDAVTASVGPVQSALEYAETLEDTLTDCAGYVNGVIGLVKDFADVGLVLFFCFVITHLSYQIHPISKIAVGALTKLYEVRCIYRRRRMCR